MWKPNSHISIVIRRGKEKMSAPAAARETSLRYLLVLSLDNRSSAKSQGFHEPAAAAT
jgi:hypothetical protein